jgi:hypothetical protein
MAIAISNWSEIADPKNSFPKKEIPPCVFSFLVYLGYKPVVEKMTEEQNKKAMNELGFLACPKLVSKYFAGKSLSIPKLIETRQFFESYSFFDEDEKAKEHLKSLKNIYTEKCSLSIFEYVNNFEVIEEKKKTIFKELSEKMELILKS